MSGIRVDDTSNRGDTSDWHLQDAKARFSEVVRRAVEQGPQHVTVNGEERAVVVSAQEYDWDARHSVASRVAGAFRSMPQRPTAPRLPASGGAGGAFRPMRAAPYGQAGRPG